MFRITLVFSARVAGWIGGCVIWTDIGYTLHLSAKTMVGGGLLILTYRCYVGVCFTRSLFWSGFLTFCSLTSKQVPIAKVLLGVCGVAVVVILIAVPTAIHLKGESAVQFVCWHAVVHHLCSDAPLNTSAGGGGNSTHASLRMIRLERC